MSPHLVGWIILYAVVVMTPFMPFMQNNVYAGPLYMVVMTVVAWLLLNAQSKKDVDKYFSKQPAPTQSARPGSTHAGQGG